MAYRVRARRAKATHYSLAEAILGFDTSVSRDAYRALREDLIRVYGVRLEVMGWFWAFEPVLEWLRHEPDRFDPRFVWGEDVAQQRDREAAGIAYESVIAGRRRWLADNGYPTTDPTRKET